ncbi:hypothetical protein E2542_SST30047 [Spatholobus suberectus]|nr:hypothetical protein E2542_SST30047 [Spatholobus suberectus]
MIEHCELDCENATVDGLNVVGNCEPKCSQGLTIPSHIQKEGQDAIRDYLDNLFSNALLGSDSTETGQNQETHPDSHAVEPDSKTQTKDEGERNMDTDKSAYKLPQKPGEEHKLTIPSHIQKEGQDAIKTIWITYSATHSSAGIQLKQGKIWKHSQIAIPSNLTAKHKLRTRD